MTPQQLQEALNHQKMSGGKLGKAFVALGFVKDEEITSLLSRQYGVPSINLDHFEVDPAITRIVPAETARKYLVLPLSRSGAVLTIAMADPTYVFAMDDIKFMTGYNVEPVVASESAIEDAIERYYGSTRSLELRRDSACSGGGGGPPTAVGRRKPQGGDGRTRAERRRHGLDRRPVGDRPRLDGRCRRLCRDGEERGRGDRPRRHGQVGERSADHQAHERDTRRLGEARGLGHPH